MIKAQRSFGMSAAIQQSAWFNIPEVMGIY